MKTQFRCGPVAHSATGAPRIARPTAQTQSPPRPLHGRLARAGQHRVCPHLVILSSGQKVHLREHFLVNFLLPELAMGFELRILQYRKEFRRFTRTIILSRLASRTRLSSCNCGPDNEKALRRTRRRAFRLVESGLPDTY